MERQHLALGLAFASLCSFCAFLSFLSFLDFFTFVFPTSHRLADLMVIVKSFTKEMALQDCFIPFGVFWLCQKWWVDWRLDNGT